MSGLWKSGQFKPGWYYLLACWILGLFQTCAQAQTTLNVKDYGAKGDAVQFYANVVSNSVVVTTTNQFSNTDIGKTIEIFGVGLQTYGVNSYRTNSFGHQDLIAIVTNVVNSTNLYISPTPQSNTNYPLPQLTSNGVFATIGTDNTTPIMNCIAAAGTNCTINFPSGMYLCMPFYRNNLDGYFMGAICIHRGGLHFLGTGKTTLLSRGAWRTERLGAARGFLLELVSPVTNDLPLIFENLTLDGGVQHGYISAGNAIGYPNPVDGLGWDNQHGAFLTYDSRGISGTITHEIFTNCIIQHWRGEMFKSVDQNTNRIISIHNSAFIDGSATALNVYGTWDVSGNTFSNLFQIAEYYQHYAAGLTNDSYFCDNFTTNIWANGLAFNGGDWTAPPFIIASNIFGLNGVGFNGIMTMPAANIYILNNTFYCADYMQVFSPGAPGAQAVNGMVNSNIVISGNSILSAKALTSVFGLGDYGVNMVYDMIICSNYISVPNQIFYITRGGPQSTGIKFNYNIVDCPMTKMQTGILGKQNAAFTLVSSNNIYTSYPLDYSTPTNHYVSYSMGPKWRMDSVCDGNVFVLKDISEASQIPDGAYLEIDNRSNRWAAVHGGTGDILIDPSEKMDSSILLPHGQQIWFYWDGKTWTTNAQSTGTSSKPVPPTSLRIMN